MHVKPYAPSLILDTLRSSSVDTVDTVTPSGEGSLRTAYPRNKTGGILKLAAKSLMSVSFRNAFFPV